MESSLRTVLATIIVLVAVMVLQIPNAAFALYVILLVSNENPALSLRTGIGALVTVSCALSISLSVVILTDNDPLARLVALAVMTFLAGMMTVVTTIPSVGPIFGLIAGVAIHSWESHASADRVLKNDLWLLAGFATGIAGAVAVSYVFSMRSPADRLAGQLRLRYRTLAAMFGTYASNESGEIERRKAAQAVSRLAAEGHRGMLELHRQITDRHLSTGSLPAAVQHQIIVVAELMDYAAAFGLQTQGLDEDVRCRSRIIAQQCACLARDLRYYPESSLTDGHRIPRTHLERVETSLYSLSSITTDARPFRAFNSLPSRRVPFLIPGAASDIANVAFGLKISLCATICYLIYHAVDWPGISTSVTTVMVTGLMTTGVMKQKLAYRLLGAIAGGLVLGLGAEVFLFPFMDSITPLLIVVSAVAFLSAWIGAGPRFNYLGIQIAFAFYLVSLSGFTAPTELAPARDRLVGIMMAVIVMWVVFDQVWPVRTTTEMRRVVASVLKDAAHVVALADSLPQSDAIAKDAEILRDRLARALTTVRTLNEGAKYEFGPDRERHIRTADKLMQMSMTAVALVWNHTAILNERDESDSKIYPSLVGLRQRVQEGLSSIADAVENKRSTTSEVLVAGESRSEYMRLTVARFNDLQSLSAAVDS